MNHIREAEFEGPERHRDRECAGEFERDIASLGVTVWRSMSDTKQVEFSLTFATKQKDVDALATEGRPQSRGRCDRLDCLSEEELEEIHLRVQSRQRLALYGRGGLRTRAHGGDR